MNKKEVWEALKTPTDQNCINCANATASPGCAGKLSYGMFTPKVPACMMPDTPGGPPPEPTTDYSERWYWKWDGKTK